MKIITDLRTLKALERKSNGLWKFDKTYKYSISKHIHADYLRITHNGKAYKLKYIDGCFYPYCVVVV